MPMREHKLKGNQVNTHYGRQIENCHVARGPAYPTSSASFDPASASRPSRSSDPKTHAVVESSYFSSPITISKLRAVNKNQKIIPFLGIGSNPAYMNRPATDPEEN